MTESTPDAAMPADADQNEQPEQAGSPAPSPAGGAPVRYPAKGFDTLYWCYLAFTVAGSLLAMTGILIFLGFPCLLAAAAFAAVFFYRAWDQIQDEHAHTSPLLAVVLMFVPLFNFYWAYIAIWGLAKDLNAYAARHGIQTPRVNEGLALGLCVMMSLGLVFMFFPILNIIAWLVTIPIALVVMHQFRSASIAIAASAG